MCFDSLKQWQVQECGNHTLYESMEELLPCTEFMTRIPKASEDAHHKALAEWVITHKCAQEKYEATLSKFGIWIPDNRKSKNDQKPKIDTKQGWASYGWEGWSQWSSTSSQPRHSWN
jgi:hypothetical protein